MRDINHIVIHCSGTPEGRFVDAATIRGWHVNERGWSDIGYHYVILLDGTVEKGRPDERSGAHVAGNNSDSLGICYIGGMSKTMEPKDTRTPEQKVAMKKLVEELYYKHRDANVLGHRDFSPDLDGDGIIEEHEWMKACPSFDVAEWFKKEILCE